MYSHPYATLISEIIYPEVGDVLIIKSRIGNYLPGDYFFVHSQDEDTVSDCSLVGVTALENFSPTVVSDEDINKKKAEVISNRYASAVLWELHLRHLSKKLQ